MAVTFEIEAVFKITNRGYFVAAKIIEEGSGFWLPEHSKLGNVAITTFCEIPRALDKQGNLRTDLWGFQLKYEEDFDKLKEGETVELFPGDALKFLTPWVKVESGERFEKELANWIPKDHPFYGKRVKAIGKREDKDDVLFEIGKDKMAIVCLTQQEKRGSSLNASIKKVFSHWTEVYEKVIFEDNRQHKSST